MSTVQLHMVSTLSPPQLAAVLTDFSARRPSVWPTIDDAHFRVQAVGDTWAMATTLHANHSANFLELAGRVRLGLDPGMPLF